jgi:tetratricopeptide (TPR) repeat protein
MPGIPGWLAVSTARPGFGRAFFIYSGLVILLPLLLAATLSGGAQAPQPDEAFLRAVALQQAGDREGAAAAYRAFIERHPTNVEARSNLGVVLAQLGRYEDAIQAYRAALKIDAKQPKIRLNLGIALYKAARYADAATELAIVRKAQPDNLQARYLEADCHLRMAETKEVIALLAPIEPQHQDDLALAYMLGVAYLHEKDVQKGTPLIDRILKRGESAEAHLMMGMAKRAAQDLAGGLEEMRMATVLNPELPTVHSLYGRALLETGNRDQARAEFEEELKRNPLDFDAHLYLGVLLKDEAKFDEAMAHFEHALSVRPGDPGVRYQMATVLVSRGESQKVLPVLEQIVKEAPQFLEAHVTLATVYYRLKRREDGDRERAIIEALTQDAQAKQPGAAAQGRPPGQ